MCSESESQFTLRSAIAGKIGLPVTIASNLNRDHNHDLKDIFKGAAMRASTAAGPLHDFYENLLAKGRSPTMARADLGQEDCRDHLDGLEEGGPFRRQLFETTSSLSASG